MMRGLLFVVLTLSALSGGQTAQPDATEKGFPVGTIVYVRLPHEISSTELKKGSVIDVDVRGEVILEGQKVQLLDAPGRLEVTQVSELKKDAAAQLSMRLTQITWKKKRYEFNGCLFGKFETPESMTLVRGAVSGVATSDRRDRRYGLPEGVELKIIPEYGPTLVSNRGEITLESYTTFAVRNTAK